MKMSHTSRAIAIMSANIECVSAPTSAHNTTSTTLKTLFFSLSIPISDVTKLNSVRFHEESSPQSVSTSESALMTRECGLVLVFTVRLSF